MVPDSDAARGGSASDADGAPAGSGSGVDSNWWYWVAAVPVYYVLATVAGVAFAVLAFGLALTGAAGVGGPPGIGVGIGFFGAFAVGLLLVGVGLVVSLVFPLAVYADAEAVAAERGDWQPDPALYGLLGLAGVVAQPLQVPLAVYYLYKRHESVGRP
jgi:hypothetical protein